MLMQSKTDWNLVIPKLYKSFGDTLYMVSLTLVFAGIIGLVLGTLLYATRKGNILENRLVYFSLNFVTNIVRPIPFIILLATLAPVTRAVVGGTVGPNPAVFVMTIGACFAVGRIVEQNLVAVDPGMVEAARSMGVGRLKILWSVVLRESLGPLVLGYTFLIIGITDMSAMAGAVAAGGLGDFALQYGYNAFNQELMMVTVVVIIVFVQCVQFVGNWLARRILRR